MVTVATSGAGVRQQASLGLMALSTQEEVENGEGILDRLCIGSCVVKKDDFLAKSCVFKKIKIKRRINAKGMLFYYSTQHIPLLTDICLYEKIYNNK